MKKQREKRKKMNRKEGMKKFKKVKILGHLDLSSEPQMLQERLL